MEEVIILDSDSCSGDEDKSEIYQYSPKTSIVGYHPKSGVIDGVITPTKKIKLCPLMRLDLYKEGFIKEFKDTWKAGKTLTSNGVEIINYPFRVCVFKNFIENTEFVDYIRYDFNEVEWTKRNLDLYELFQSKDLKHIDLEHIREFYLFMKDSVMPWVANLTGFDLVEISATCSGYSTTDYLLVHDDQREDRMIAFVYYVTRPDGWDASKGGCLDLLSKDDNELPSDVVKSIVPKNNQLVIFPVTNDSYHQVSEVTTVEDSRLTINGWFHVKTPPVFKIPKFEYSENGLFGNHKNAPKDLNVQLQSWIDEKYMSNEDGALDDIQKHIEEYSEISLRNFFREESVEEVMQCLTVLDRQGEKWSKAAPPNRSKYEVLSIDSLPSPLGEFLDLLQSERFFAFLKKITDLDLKSMKFELQRWTPGSYCLLSDHVSWNSTRELDVMIYFPCGDENDIIGGRIQYVNAEEEVQDALITIEPAENTLNIVYRDTARFTKYYSKQSAYELEDNTNEEETQNDFIIGDSSLDSLYLVRVIAGIT